MARNTLEHFQTMMEQYLKQSFKNGIEVGMKKAKVKGVTNEKEKRPRTMAGFIRSIDRK